jgi:hypothetical protein
MPTAPTRPRLTSGDHDRNRHHHRHHRRYSDYRFADRRDDRSRISTTRITDAPVPPAGATSSANASSSSSTGTATATNDDTTASAIGVGALTVAQYGSDPVSTPLLYFSGEYFDVAVSIGNSFTSATITDCNLGGGNSFEWFNGTANAGSGAWQAVTPTPR